MVIAYTFIITIIVGDIHVDTHVNLLEYKHAESRPSSLQYVTECLYFQINYKVNLERSVCISDY